MENKNRKEREMTTKPDILADIKHKSDEPATYASDEKLMVVLTIVDKNIN